MQPGRRARGSARAAGVACACVLLLILPAAHVRGDDMSELTEADLVGPVLQMLAGASSGAGRRFINVCDLAVSLLQAVEATKAERVQDMKRKQHRTRRADADLDDGGGDAHVNPVLGNIVKSYLRARREDTLEQRRRARMESALAKAKQDLEEQFRLPTTLQEEGDDEDIFLAVPIEDEDKHGDDEGEAGAPSSVIQKIVFSH